MTVLHRLEYAAVMAARGTMRVLPMPAAIVAGTILGRAFHAIDGTHRRLALKNLEAAFPSRPAAERAAIARDMFAHFGRLLTVLLKFSTMTPAQMLARVEFEGEERVRAAHATRPGRAAVHRSFRLLGDQRPGARARAPSDVGAGAAARQSTRCTICSNRCAAGPATP